MQIPQPLPEVPYKISEAIAREEGFYSVGKLTRAQRNNNPGNLEYNDFTKSMGAVSGDPRFAIFPDLDRGWAALRTLLANNYKGQTIADMICKYAPTDENDTALYILHVCDWTKLAPTTVIDDYV